MVCAQVFNLENISENTPKYPHKNTQKKVVVTIAKEIFNLLN